MNRTILVLCLIILGGTDVFFCRIPYPCPDYKIELGLSMVEHIPSLLDPLEPSNKYRMDGLCAEIQLLYNYKKGHTISGGLNFYKHNTAFTCPAPTEDCINKKAYLTYSSNIIALPISYTLDKRLSPAIGCFIEGGLCLNIPYNKSYEQNDHTVSSSTGNEEAYTQFTMLNNQGLPMTAFVKLGLLTNNHDGYYFKISGIINHSLKEINVGELEYTETAPNYRTTGTLTSAFGYYGISVDFVFSLDRKDLKRVERYF